MRSMRHKLETVTAAFLFLGCSATCVAQQAGSGFGIFEGHGDVGVTPKPGSVEYDSASGEYRVTGGGANIWSTTDAFQFAWNRLSGDVTLTADVRLIGSGKVNHRKAVFMIRQGLDPVAMQRRVGVCSAGSEPLANHEHRNSGPPRARRLKR